MCVTYYIVGRNVKVLLLTDLGVYWRISLSPFFPNCGLRAQKSMLIFILPLVTTVRYMKISTFLSAGQWSQSTHVSNLLLSTSTPIIHLPGHFSWATSLRYNTLPQYWHGHVHVERRRWLWYLPSLFRWWWHLYLDLADGERCIYIYTFSSLWY